MTEIEHLLATLAEEAAEVTQACMKALRFGLDDVRPGTDYTKEQWIARELADMRGTIELLREHGVALRGANDNALAERKKAKVLELMELARERGRLDR